MTNFDVTHIKDEDIERLKKAATGKYIPYETNITDFNILQKGDVIKSNDSMHAIFLGIEKDMVKVFTASGNIMKISKTNKIDWFG